MSWYNDGEYRCNDCDSIFKIYYKGDVNFCPNCTSRDIELMDDEIED